MAHNRRAKVGASGDRDALLYVACSQLTRKPENREDLQTRFITCGCPEWGLVDRCKGMTLGHGGRTPGRTPPSRWRLSPASAKQRCSGRRLNPSTAHYNL
eukprot:3686738-Prymnesium_polylepis.1